MVERAIAMGGTCTGEHGVGLGKIAHVEQEHGAGVDLMRRIKRALDPDNILNPGKIFRLDPDDALPRAVAPRARREQPIGEPRAAYRMRYEIKTLIRLGDFVPVSIRKG